MSENTLISIIIPVYNAEKYLAETLESLTAQSYPTLEIICVDDGSQDRSAEIITQFQTEDCRVKYIRQENAGPGAARNNGLRAVQGEYVIFQDADDLLCRDAVKLMLEEIENTQADLCVCSYKLFSDADSFDTERIFTPYEAEICTGDLPLQFEDYQKFRGHPWGKLYRSDIVKKLQFPDLRSGEDTYFNIDVMIKCSKVVILPLPLYGYRENSASLTHSKKHHCESIEAGEAISLHCIELFSKAEISEKAAIALLQRYGTNCIMLHTLLMLNNPSLKKSEQKELFEKIVVALRHIKSNIPWNSGFISDKYRLIYLMVITLRMRWICYILFQIRTVLVQVKR